MPRGVHNPQLKEEAIKLRLQEHLSYNEIHARLGVPKGTLSYWLSSYPLADEEVQAKIDRGVAKSTELAKKNRIERKDINATKLYDRLVSPPVTFPTIPGLFLFPDFISDKEEKNLLTKIDEQEWCLDLKRRTQHYGFKYDYTKKRINDSMRAQDIPEWMHPIQKLVTPLFDKEPDQIIVNEYEPGQGISPHVDCVPCFGPVIASLTLQSPTLMDLRVRYSRKTDFTIQLTPRSLLLLEREARFDFAHSIPRQEDTRRVSVTFRTIILS